jgi:hypothetical protein
MSFVVVDVSGAAYKEIREKLASADYGDRFQNSAGRDVIDLSGIALASKDDGLIDRIKDLFIEAGMTEEGARQLAAYGVQLGTERAKGCK